MYMFEANESVDRRSNGNEAIKSNVKKEMIERDGEDA